MAKGQSLGRDACVPVGREAGVTPQGEQSLWGLEISLIPQTGNRAERETGRGVKELNEIVLSSFNGVSIVALVSEDGSEVFDFEVRGGPEGNWSYCHGDLNGAVKRFAEDAGMPWAVVWQ
jgi:hypothetical protein